MSDLSIDLDWRRAEEELRPGQFSNSHKVTYNDQYTVEADAAPDWGGDAARINPEQTLAAAVSSCHMMTFLALAAKAGWPVARFSDRAVAQIGKNPDGKMAVTRIDLHPVVEFDPGFSLEPAKLDEMQDRAHRYCFVSNSLAQSVEINIETA